MKNSLTILVCLLAMVCIFTSCGTSTGSVASVATQPDVRSAIEVGRVVGRVAIVRALESRGVPAQTSQLALSAIDPVIDAALATGKFDVLQDPTAWKPVRDELASKAGKALADAINVPGQPAVLTADGASLMIGTLIDGVADRARAAMQAKNGSTAEVVQVKP